MGSYLHVSLGAPLRRERERDVYIYIYRYIHTHTQAHLSTVGVSISVYDILMPASLSEDMYFSRGARFPAPCLEECMRDVRVNSFEDPRSAGVSLDNNVFYLISWVLGLGFRVKV